MGGPGSGRKPKVLPRTIRLVRGEEMTPEEIQAALGYSHEGLRKIYQSALSKLRERIPREWLASVLPPASGRSSETLRVFRAGSATMVEFAAFNIRVPPSREHPYPDWHSSTSVVVSGPLRGFNFPGREFNSRTEARQYWLERAGHIYEEHFISGRYVFRVRRGTKDPEAANGQGENTQVPLPGPTKGVVTHG